MSIAEKLVTIAENQQRVYEAGYAKGRNETDTEKVYNDGVADGKEAEYNRFWDEFTWNGERTDYMSAFRSWSIEEFHPTRKIIPTNAQQLFYLASNLKKVEAAYLDLSQQTEKNSVYLNFSTFNNCKELEDLSEIDFPCGGYSYTFYECRKLHSIGTLNFDESDYIQNRVFHYCDELQNLKIAGTIGQNGFNISYSTKLTHESLMSIINALKDYSEDTSGTSHSITLGSTNLAKLTDAEKAIATEKGWTLA